MFGILLLLSCFVTGLEVSQPSVKLVKLAPRTTHHAPPRQRMTLNFWPACLSPGSVGTARAVQSSPNHTQFVQRWGIKLLASALYQLRSVPVPTRHRFSERMQSLRMFFLKHVSARVWRCFLKIWVYVWVGGCLRGCHFEQSFGFLPGKKPQGTRDEMQTALRQWFSSCGSQRLWGGWMAPFPGVV